MIRRLLWTVVEKIADGLAFVLCHVGGALLEWGEEVSFFAQRAFWKAGNLEDTDDQDIPEDVQTKP